MENNEPKLLKEDKEIEKEIKELIKLKNKYLASFSDDEKEKAEKVFNFISQQLNEMSFRGEIDFVSYKLAVMRSVDALFKLIYFTLIDIDGEKPLENMLKGDILFASSKNFLILLFSRATGKDRELILKDIETKKPVVISNK